MGSQAKKVNAIRCLIPNVVFVKDWWSLDLWDHQNQNQNKRYLLSMLFLINTTKYWELALLALSSLGNKINNALNNLVEWFKNSLSLENVHNKCSQFINMFTTVVIGKIKSIQMIVVKCTRLYNHLPLAWQQENNNVNWARISKTLSCAQNML